MAWVYLMIAGIGEVIGVMGINQVKEQKNWRTILVLVLGFVISFFFLSIAMKTLQMSTAYAVWTGIGTVGSTGIGIVIYHESKDWRRILCIGMIIIAAVGLKLVSN